MSTPRFYLALAIVGSVVANSTTPSSFEANRNPSEGSEVTLEGKYAPQNAANVIVDESKNTTTLAVRTSLARILNFYNTELLAARWGSFCETLTRKCRRDMEGYMEALDKAEDWALRMDDASGRYSRGWFWGNNYWMGSQNLCGNLASKKHTIVDSKVARAAVKISIINHPSPSGGTEPVAYTNGPPFPISFFRLRLHLNCSFTSEEKLVRVGLCLPLACTDSDVRKMVEETSASAPKITVKVLAVRSEHNKFIIWTDKTFIILSVATFITICFLIAGTSLDYRLEHLKASKTKDENSASCNGKLDVSDIKSKTDKGGTVESNNNNNNNSNNNVDHHSSDINTGYNETSTSTMRRMVWRDMLLSFSVRMNVNAICNRAVGTDTLSVIHGLKAITMVWVILEHTCIMTFKYADNKEYRKVVQGEFLLQTITNGTYCVDTFFFSSGLLVSFLYFRTNARGKLEAMNKENKFVRGLLHFIGLVAYRFARLTVPYMFAVGFVVISMKWFTHNSVFEPVSLDYDNCGKYWWRNVLYINTLFPGKEMCMVWSWYLSNDTQFYIMGAVMLILATSHFKSAVTLLVAFGMSSLMTTAYIAYDNRHIPVTDNPLVLFDKIFDKPWTRMSPYLIGMGCGWYLFQKNCRVRMSKFLIASGWTASLAVLSTLMYGLHQVKLDPWVGAAYTALSHSAWAAALAWIVVACVTGHGGIINEILSSTWMYPISRVTYCAYLIHPMVLRLMVMSVDTPLHLGKYFTFIMFFGQTVSSFILAFLFSVMYEAPTVSLLRIIPKVDRSLRKVHE